MELGRSMPGSEGYPRRVAASIPVRSRLLNLRYERHAPSFVFGAFAAPQAAHPYSALTLGKFLGFGPKIDPNA